MQTPPPCLFLPGLKNPPPTHPPCVTSRHPRLLSNLHVAAAETNHAIMRSGRHFPHDVVPLAEEREPLVQHFLLLLAEILPFGPAVFGLEARLGEGARGVAAGED